MAKLSLVQGTTSKSIGIFVQDSSQTNGVGLSGLAYNSAGLIAYWFQPGVTNATAITLGSLANPTSAYNSGGFIQVDATNAKGMYRFDLPNAMLTGASDALCLLSGATNMAPVALEIELTTTNNQITNGIVNSNVVNVLGTGSAGAAGYMGLDWSAIHAPTSTAGLSNTTISTTQTITSVSGSVGSILGITFPTNFATLAIDSNGNVKLQATVKKNTALNGFPFYMASSTDHISPGTGKAITAVRALDGGAFASCANSATEIGSGWYQINLAAGDLNGNTVALSFSATGCDTTLLTLTTQP